MNTKQKLYPGSFSNTSSFSSSSLLLCCFLLLGSMAKLSFPNLLFTCSPSCSFCFFPLKIQRKLNWYTFLQLICLTNEWAKFAVLKTSCSRKSSFYTVIFIIIMWCGLFNFSAEEHLSHHIFFLVHTLLHISECTYCWSKN